VEFSDGYISGSMLLEAALNNSAASVTSRQVGMMRARQAQSYLFSIGEIAKSFMDSEKTGSESDVEEFWRE
jgi:hypothetical protein